MNKTYRLIWNHRLNAWIVASELTRTSGKKASGRTRAGVAAVVLALGASLPLAAADLAPGALPTGGTVVVGQADIAASGTRMDITQGSQKAIINWQGFDIGSQAQVNFAQPNASAVALNRVSGPTATRIEGQLTANGQVFLINSIGVLFGNGARVNAGAFVASTLNIGDDDFLAGKYTFTGTGGAIENQGAISAVPGGYVAFIAPKITNAGTLSAPQGTVAMGAGERVTLNFAGDRLVGLSVAAETLDTLIENRQAIRAEGGAILLTAAGAEAVTRSVINNSGVLEAGSLTADGGRIVLTAGNDINLGAGSTVAVDGKKGGEITVQAKSGTLLADGSLSARGASGIGGSVQLLGRQVGLVNAAQVDASGATGGGSVLFGGDYQGGNAEVANARATYVAPDVTIKANALQQGDGGKVIVWADEIARFYGTISADGAGTGGNGGFVETSGKAVLDASGSVSALGAGGGSAGNWLLDPYDITIQTAGTNTNVTASPNFTSNGNSAIVTTGSIQTALNVGTSVTVATGAGGAQAGNITVANAINKTAGGNASLTLTAINNIVFNVGADIGATAGQLALTLNAGGTITNPATINTNGGLLTYNATGAATQSGVVSGAGGVTKTGAGTLTLSGANTYTGATTINAGTLTASGGSAIADTSQVMLANTAGATLNLANSETIGNLSGGGATGGNVTLGANTLTVNEGGTTTYSGVISGTGGLTKAGTGTLTLSRANSYSGSTTINAGTLALGASNVLANGSSVVVNGGTLNIANRSDTVAGVQLVSGSILGTTGTLTSTTAYDLQSGTVSAQLGGAVGLNKTTSGIVTLSGANSYTGATNINAGTLALGAANRINNASAVTVASGATFNLANFAETVGSLAGAGNVTLGSAILTAGGDNTSTTFSGVASGTGGLTKAGTGALTLSGANTYTGATTINAGTLVAANAAALGAAGGTDTVASGATLNINNVSITGENVSIAGTGVGAAGALTGSGTAMWGGSVAMTANSTVGTAAAADTLVLNGVVSGASTLTKAGAGTLTLSGNNTYGSTTISAGTLQIGAGGTTGTLGIGAVTDNAALVFNRSNALTVTTTINGTGTLTQAGTGTTTLTANNAYTGTTTISAGTLQVGGGGTTGSLGTGAVTDNAALVFNRSNALTVASAIGGTGTLTQAGTGTTTLTADNTYAGTTTISAGTLQVGAGGTTGSLGTGAVTDNAALIFNRSNALTVANAISGTGTVTKTSAGTLTLSGANTYTGATNINGGTLTASGGNALPDASQVNLANNAGATLNLANSETIGNLSGGGTTGGNVTLGANTLTVNEAGATTYSGVVSGTGGVTKAGTGTLTLGGVNTYTGATNINAGTLALNATGTIAQSSGVANNGTFTIAAAKTIDSMTGTGNTVLGGTLTIGDASNTSSAYSGVISGAGGLTKAGTGTLTLSGANTYTGVTTISAGTLSVNSIANVGGGASALGAPTTAANGTIALAGGATLQYTGAGSSSNRVINLTSSGGIVDASGSGALTLSGGVTGNARNLTLTGTGVGTESGAIATTSGTITKAGTGTWTLSGANTYTGATNINAGTLAVTANNALGTTAAGTTVASGATLDFRNVAYAATEAVTLNGGTLATSVGTSSFAGPVTLGADGNVDVGGTQLTLPGIIGGAGFGITKQGSGELVLSGSNTYTGATNINAGTLTAAGGNAIPDASQVNLANVAGATLNLAGSETIGNLAGGGAAGGNVTLGANTLTVNQNAATNYAGTISGSGGLTKTGAGTLTLAGANTYAGVTNINAGMLVAANAAALGGTGGGTNVGSNARLSIDNVALGAEPVTLNGSGLFGTGAITSNGSASLAGPVTLAGDAVIAPNGGSTLILSGPVDGAFGLTTGGFGTLNLNGAVGGVTPLAFLTTLATAPSSATRIGTSVRTTGNQSYNNPTTLGAGAALQSTGGNISLNGVVTASGAVSLQAAGDLLFQNSGSFGTLAATAGGTVILGPAGQLAATGTGDAIVLSGSRFVNSAGAGALTATNGRWLVWSSNSNPFGGATPDNRGGLAYGFKQYNATYGVTPVQGAGNGFLYTVAPIITPSLTGTVSKVYDGNNTAMLAPANLIASGAVDGDSVVLAAASAIYDSRNVGTGKTVTATGITASASNGTAAVYGYTVSPSSASGPVGEITPAALTVSSIGAVSTTYGTPAATGAVSLNGVISGDSVTSTASLVGPTFSTSGNLSAGSYAQSAGSLGGADAGNYTLTAYTTPTNNYSVGQLALTGSILAGDKVYDSTTAAIISSRSLSGVIVGDSVSYVGGIANFSDKNVGAAKTVTGSGLGLSGPDAGNYTVNSVASTTASITPAPLTLNAVSDTKVYDGTTGSSGVVGTVGLQGSDSVGNLSQSYASKNVLGTNASTLAVNGGYIVNDGNGGANYSVTTTTAKGTISPAPLTIAANDASKLFGTPNPPFTATYSGFVGGETPSVLNGALSFQTVAGTTSPPGNYAITPYGQTSSNYAIVFRDGVLTINGSPSGPGDAGATGADQQAIGAQYTSQGAPTLALAMIQYIRVEGDCVDETATPHGSCAGQPPGTSLVRVVNGGISMPRQ